jgi:putative FmdB family regulatory protein
MSPFYEFKCEKCLRLEEHYFSFQEEHKVDCPNCKEGMNKVIQATPAIFTGGGWGGKP